jgi:amino acid transporter
MDRLDCGTVHVEVRILEILMKNLVSVLVAVLSFLCLTILAYKEWRKGNRSESIALLMLSWGGGGLLLISAIGDSLYLLLGSAFRPPELPRSLTVGIILIMGFIGITGALWSVILRVCKHKSNKKRPEHWYGD